MFHHHYYGNYLLPTDIQTNSLLSIPQPQFHFPRYNEPHPIKTTLKEKSTALETSETKHLPSMVLPETVVVSPKKEIRINDIEMNKSMNIQLPPLEKPPSLAPFRAHPLLHYVKNRNTINPNKIISFRNNDISNGPSKDITTLILKPVARSIAGVDGTAISTPLSRAILRQGMNVDILFEPEAVAIAGPGGIAHAESDLEITYEDII